MKKGEFHSVVFVSLKLDVSIVLEMRLTTRDQRVKCAQLGLVKFLKMRFRFRGRFLSKWAKEPIPATLQCQKIAKKPTPAIPIPGRFLSKTAKDPAPCGSDSRNLIKPTKQVLALRREKQTESASGWKRGQVQVQLMQLSLIFFSLAYSRDQ